MEDLKRAFGRSVFFRDLAAIEPGKKGVVIGEDVRINVEADGSYVLRFLKGTPVKTRKQYQEKLDAGSINYKVGKDFTS